MRISKATSLLLSAAVAVAVAAPAAAGPGNDTKPGAQSDNPTVVCNEESGDTVTLDGDTLLWPPNHKMVPITIGMTDVDQDPEPVEFATTTTNNETTYADDGSVEEEMNGTGKTSGDEADIDAATGDDYAEGELEVRAERSGRGEGRVYTVDVIGMAGDDECRAQFTIVVPHDMRPSNRVKPDNG